MKPGIHPEYGPVVYQDMSTGDAFLTRSTLAGSAQRSRETIEWSDGETYPLVKVDTTSASHPFWTGNARVLDSAGQVEKFRRRYGSRQKG